MSPGTGFRPEQTEPFGVVCGHDACAVAVSPRRTGTGSTLTAVAARTAALTPAAGVGASGVDVPEPRTPGAGKPGADLVEVVRQTAALYAQARRLEVDRVLELVADGARTILPGVACAGVSVVDARGRIEGRGTGPLTARLQQVQRELGEGPTWSAARMRRRVGDLPVMWVEDTASGTGPDGLWPRFAVEALRLGVHAAISVPLQTGHRSGPVACLDLLCARRGAFGPDTRSMAEVYAQQAATALEHARDVADLEQALASRDLIGQAKGVLMQRHAFDADAAWAMLVDASQAANVKVRDVAVWLTHDVVSGAAAPGPAATETT